ncbi:glycosyltransferase family 2 protein [Flavobacterium sp. PL12]|uniref:glycosyltransferase family 2 protein n=1 Tax=Flavobacterium sp. PL12 TaxID=3071718 RepID=UPI00319E14C4
MENNPFISVLMPVYNCELYIKEAVESILNQTYTNFELLLIDDCSNDTTLQICKSFQDERIVIIEKEKNTGYTNSLNYGLAIAKGKYIARMDGDDISLPDRFEKQFAFMEANEDVVVCGTSFSIIGSNKLIRVPETHNEIKVGLLKECKIGHPAVMLRKSVLDNYRITYDKLMEPAEDYDLWVRLSIIGKLHNLQECLLNYRIHELQVSKVRNSKQEEAANKIRLKLVSLFDNSITDCQKGVYLKAIKNKELLDFKEFEILINLKQQLFKKNKNEFFNTEEFLRYWISIERTFISHYFKNRKNYSVSIFLEYIRVFSLLSSTLSVKETIKLFIKSLIHHKVK